MAEAEEDHPMTPTIPVTPEGLRRLAQTYAKFHVVDPCELIGALRQAADELQRYQDFNYDKMLAEIDTLRKYRDESMSDYQVFLRRFEAENTALANQQKRDRMKALAETRDNLAAKLKMARDALKYITSKVGGEMGALARTTLAETDEGVVHE